MYRTNPDSAECSISSTRPFRRQGVWLVLVAAHVLVCSLGAAELSLPTQVAHAGSVVTMNIEYSTRGANAAALEFDLEYDASALTIVADPGSATMGAGKFLAMNLLSSGHIRFLIFGFNEEIIGDGAVVVLTIQVSTNSSVGPHRLDVLNAQGADPSGQDVPVETRPGMVVRVGPP